MDDPLRIIREMNGAPMTILILLGLQAGPVEQTWMESVIGISDKPVSRALGYLQMLRFVAHTEDGWLLTGAGRHLLQRLVPPRAEALGRRAIPAPAAERQPEAQPDQPAAPPEEALPPEDAAPPEVAPPPDDPGFPGPDFPVELTRNISDSYSIKESIQNHLTSIGRRKQIQRPPPAEFPAPEGPSPPDRAPEGAPENAPAGGCAGEAPPAREPGELEAVWAELRQAGVRRNARTRALAARPHLTPGYVRAHREAMQELGQSGPEWAGLLITLLEEGEPAPARASPITCPRCSQYPCACEEYGWEEGPPD